MESKETRTKSSGDMDDGQFTDAKANIYQNEDTTD